MSRKHLVESNSTELESGCWQWTGALDKRGYGTKRIGSRDDNKNWFAHRLSYQEFVKPLTEGLQVNHTCDNPACVNPEHLYEGTQQQNMQDKKDRGRTLGRPVPNMQGVKHHGARLTEEEVMYLRSKRQEGSNITEIWRNEFSHLACSTIQMAAKGSNYRYV